MGECVRYGQCTKLDQGLADFSGSREGKKNSFYENRIKDKDEIIYEEEVTEVSSMAKAVSENKINIILEDDKFGKICSILKYTCHMFSKEY